MSRLILCCLILFMVFAGLNTYAENNDILTDTNTVALRQKIDLLKIDGLSIDDIKYIAEGSYYSPGAKTPAIGLPAFMRVAATVKPVPGSVIKMEVWLPVKTWNGKFLGTGNGGGGGYIAYNTLAQGIQLGYATGNANMGTYPSADSAVNHPQRWIDFGYRATHLMTVISKEMIKAYYNKAQQYAYFMGCSTGGQQAMMEAQRYPHDYNGIIAGAPANNRTHLHTDFLWNYRASRANGDSLFTKEEIADITRTFIAQYAGKDGGNKSDTFLTDPRLDKFDAELFLKTYTRVTGKNLSSVQMDALKKIYAGPVNPRTGGHIYTPFPPGSEGSSLGLWDQEKEKNFPSQHFYQLKWVFGLNYDFNTFDYDKDQAKLDSALAPILNANNPDLSAFKGSGAKLIMYTGTADPIVPFQDAVNYYERVIEKQQGLKNTQSFFRYFLVPGMGHCSGGPGLNDFGQNIDKTAQPDSEHDVLMAMVNWVEKGIAPEKLIASALNCCAVKNSVRFQRPIYPYPKFPKYIKGDINAASSYIGVDHPRGMVVKPADVYLK